MLSWVQQGQQRSAPVPFMGQSHEESRPLKITASYATHSEWQYIRKTLEKCAGVRNLSLVSLSPQRANLNITYGGPIDQLTQALLQKGILLSQQEEGWIVSSNGQALR